MKFLGSKSNLYQNPIMGGKEKWSPYWKTQKQCWQCANIFFKLLKVSEPFHIQSLLDICPLYQLRLTNIGKIELTSSGLAKTVVTYWRESQSDEDILNRSANSVTREVEKTIGSRTARRWLRKLGFQYKEYWKEIYNDRHERQDVKDYRDKKFLPCMAAYQDRLLHWDEHL